MPGGRRIRGVVATLLVSRLSPVALARRFGWGFPALVVGRRVRRPPPPSPGPRSGKATGVGEGMGRVAARTLRVARAPWPHARCTSIRLRGGAIDRRVATSPGCNVARRSYTECLALARRGLAHAGTTAVAQPFVHPAGSVNVRPALGPRARAPSSAIPPKHRSPGSPTSAGAPDNLSRCEAPDTDQTWMHGRRTSAARRENVDGSHVAKATTSEARRSDS